MLRRLTLAAALLLSLGNGALAQSRPELTVAVDALWPTLEPVIGFSTSSNRFLQNVFDPLVRRDWVADPAGNTYAPWLASAWKKKSDTVWELTIRQGVKFHDGIEMNAEDVAFTLSPERLWGDKPIAPRGKSFMRGIIRVTATGPYTVEIETAQPDPVLVNRFVFQIGYVVPKNYRGMTPEQFGQKPIGTGPYKVTSFTDGDQLRMEAFDGYWAGKPPAAAVTWKVVPESSARMAGIVSGQYDFIVGIPPDQEPVFQRYPDITLVKRAIDNYPMLAFDTMTSKESPDNPLVNADLRKALVMAVDMPTIVKSLWGDSTAFYAPFNFPEYGTYYDPAKKPRYPYDPAKAKELVKASGYKGQALRWHIVKGFFPNYEEAAQVMAEQWREAGINVQLVMLDNFNLAYQRPFHLLTMSMSSEFSGDPMRPLVVDWGPGSNRVDATNKTWVPTPRYLELSKKFEAEGDPEKRKAYYRDLVAEWEEVTPALYMWRNVSTWAHRKGIKWVPTTTEVMRMDAADLQIQ